MAPREASAAFEEERYGWSSAEKMFIMPGGGASFDRAHLMYADLTGANLIGAQFDKAYLHKAKLERADLSWARLSQANLRWANLKRANLVGAVLRWATLDRAILDNAKLIGADLSGAQLVETRLAGTHLTGCHIYGISAWGLKLSKRTEQKNLVITTRSEPEITADNIEVAQFLYLLLHNEKIREVINSVTTKAVLLLGRFTPERKAVLDALREELRRRDYLPILFDFDQPAGRDVTETVSLLAHMVRFIIADLTDPSSIPKELEAIVPDLAVPVQLLLEGLSRPYSMFKDYWKYDWVLPPHRYEGLNLLLATLAEKVIAPAEEKVKALEERRRAIEEELTAPRARS